MYYVIDNEHFSSILWLDLIAKLPYHATRTEKRRITDGCVCSVQEALICRQVINSGHDLVCKEEKGPSLPPSVMEPCYIGDSRDTSLALSYKEC